MNKCQSWTIIPELASSPVNGRMFPAVLVNGKNKRADVPAKTEIHSASWQVEVYLTRLWTVTKDTDTTLRYVMEVP